MGARHRVLGALLFSSVFVGLVQGCGATESNTSDAGPDTTEDRAKAPVDTGADTSRSKRDAASDAIEDTPSEACGIDADLETISIPDATIGSSSVGLCLMCAKAGCNSEIEACNADCACKEALVEVLACVSAGTAFITCAEEAASEMNAEELGLCIYSACPVACGIKAATPEGGTDGPSEAAHGG